MNSAVDVRIHGRVQGVGFRWHVLRTAERLGAVGFVRNTHDGEVEIHAEGSREGLDALLREVRIGPSSAHVVDLDIRWISPTEEYSRFEIR